MNIYAFFALLNLLASALLGFFVYTQNPRNIVNKTFTLFCFFIAVWSVAYIFWQLAQTQMHALFWSRALMAGTIFVSISYFHFIIVFVNKLKKYKKYLIIGYPILTFFFLANLTPYFIANVTTKLNFPFWPEPGILFHPFLALWAFFVLFTLYILFKEHRGAFSEKFRTQLRYILLGTIVGYLGGLTNYFLWYDIPIPPIGNWAATFYLGIVTYAIVTERLFDIRIVLTQMLVGIISILLFINFILSKTTFEYFWKGGLLIAFLAAGYQLVKSVVNEIKQRQELEQAYIKLKELDEAKSEFVSIASHQLRTPLTAIKGYISMLAEETYGKLLPKQKKPIANIYDSNERLIRLVNDLLNISRIESGRVQMEWQKAKLHDVVQGVIDELQLKAKEKKLKLILQKPDIPLPSFNMDPVKVRNVILNIIDNAIRYTNKGSVILQLTAQPENRSFQTKDVLITIKDTGEGMSKEDLQHLFESFSRGKTGTKMWTEGAGLGLYIAKQFVQMHKGKIWAESSGKGKGSTFYVKLPVQ